MAVKGVRMPVTMRCDTSAIERKTVDAFMSWFKKYEPTRRDDGLDITVECPDENGETKRLELVITVSCNDDGHGVDVIIDWHIDMEREDGPYRLCDDYTRAVCTTERKQCLFEYVMIDGDLEVVMSGLRFGLVDALHDYASHDAMSIYQPGNPYYDLGM